MVTLILVLLVLACGDDATTEPTPTAEPSPTATATATPEPPVDLDASGERIFEHTRVLAVEIGPRPAGTDAEREGAAYVRETLESYGYEVAIQEFEFEARDFVPSRIEAPDGDRDAYSFAGSPDGEGRGRLIDAGLGSAGDFSAAADGAVALVRRGDITFQDKVANASAAGAVAVIVYNNEPGRFLGAVESSDIPVVGIDQLAGESLLDLAVDGADVTVYVPPRSGMAVNVIAMRPGSERCETVTGGHHDTVAVTGGASDNASGTAAVLEVARLAAAHELDGDHCFVLFGAEELGLIGSAAYVRELPDVELDGLRAMLNLDVVGVAEPLVLIGSPDLVDMAGRHAVESGVVAQPGGLPEGVASDHVNFMREGVPVLMFNRRDPLIHTPADVIDRIEPQALEDAVTLAFAVLRDLAQG